MGSAQDEGALQKLVLIIWSGKEKCLQSSLEYIQNVAELI